MGQGLCYAKEGMMGKFSGVKAPGVASSPVRTTDVIGTTYEGGPGHERDVRSELFLLAVTNMVGEQTFYEPGKARDERYVALIRQATAEHPEWVARLVPYVRDRMNLRSAALVLAAEYVKAGGRNGRAVVASALQRPDEPAEMLAYWTATHGRNVPKPVKRGVADAVTRMYDERAALRYDGTEQRWRMGDVIELVHPTPKADWQRLLFKWLLNKRHDRTVNPVDEWDPIRGTLTTLGTLAGAAILDGVPQDERRALLDRPGIAESFRKYGMSWERLSSWLGGQMDAKAWGSVIPSMGYMALLRNLRNLDNAGVDDAKLDAVALTLTDPAMVASSRQLPLRFYSAWKSVQSMRWGPVLETALHLSLGNVPVLPGRTLILIDVSGSMNERLSEKSDALRWETAGLFGIALANRADAADVYAYADRPQPMDVRKATSILRAVDAIKPLVGGGTNTWGSLAATFNAHDRVVIITDEQAPIGNRVWTGSAYVAAYANIPPNVPVYTFNVAGYKMAHGPSVYNRHTFGGLTDAGFAAIGILERSRSLDWDGIFA
jgi:hypothetical protein